MRWSEYILTGSNSTRDRSELSTEESAKPTKDNSEDNSVESSQSSVYDDCKENCEESSQSTIDDSEESPEIPFLSSHKIAKQWFTAGKNREETRRISSNIVAHTIFDILTQRQFYFEYEKGIDIKEYESDVKNILKTKQFIFTNIVDYIN